MERKQEMPVWRWFLESYHYGEPMTSIFQWGWSRTVAGCPSLLCSRGLVSSHLVAVASSLPPGALHPPPAPPPLAQKVFTLSSLVLAPQGLSTTAAPPFPRDGHKMPKADKKQEERASGSSKKLSPSSCNVALPPMGHGAFPWGWTRTSPRGFCSFPSAPWPPGRASPPLQTPAEAWPLGEDPTTGVPGLHPPLGPVSRPPLPPPFTTLRPCYTNVSLEKQGLLRGEQMSGKQRWALGQDMSVSTCSASPYLGDAHPEETRKS